MVDVFVSSSFSTTNCAYCYLIKEEPNRCTLSYSYFVSKDTLIENELEGIKRCLDKLKTYKLGRKDIMFFVKHNYIIGWLELKGYKVRHILPNDFCGYKVTEYSRKARENNLIKTKSIKLENNIVGSLAYKNKIFLYEKGCDVYCLTYDIQVCIRNVTADDVSKVIKYSKVYKQSKYLLIPKEYTPPFARHNDCKIIDLSKVTKCLIRS